MGATEGSVDFEAKLVRFLVEDRGYVEAEAAAIMARHPGVVARGKLLPYRGSWTLGPIAMALEMADSGQYNQTTS
jgi:hypothetical protein